MTSLLRYIMLLALVVWLGGIIFFGAVMAPNLFRALPPDIAAQIVGPSLATLHRIGLAGGAICLVGLLVQRAFAQRSLLPAFLMLVMMALTAGSQFYVTPRMQQLRPALAREVNAAPTPEWEIRSKEARKQFDRLHHWSTRIEGTVLILGLIVLGFLARPAETPSRDGSLPS